MRILSRGNIRRSGGAAGERAAREHVECGRKWYDQARVTQLGNAESLSYHGKYRLAQQQYTIILSVIKLYCILEAGTHGSQ